MLKSLLQKLINLTAKKGADGSFPNYDRQIYGSENQSNFSYTAPSDGDFLLVSKIQRNVFFEMCIYTPSKNKIFAGRFSTDEDGYTKSYTNLIRLNKGDKAQIELISGSFVSLEWRFFPAKL